MTLPDICTHAFNARIWKTSIDTTNSLMALELRSDEEVTVSFSVIDLFRNELVVDQISFEESWWVSLNAISYPFIFFQHFEGDQTPKQNKISVFHIDDQELLWECEGFHLEFFDDKYAYGFMMDEDSKPVYSKIELMSGSFAEVSKESLEIKRVAVLSKENKEASFPVVYHEEDDYFLSLKKFFVFKFRVEITKACEYLEYGEFVIIAYYVLETDKLTHRLLLMDKKMNILYHEKLEEMNKGIASGSFFVYRNKLISIQSKNNLLTLDLSLNS